MIMYANYNLLFDSCEVVIITDFDNNIVKILKGEDDKVEDNVYSCDVHNEHKIGDYINIKECNKFPNTFKTFRASEDLFMYLSKMGNRDSWAGYRLQLLSDEDGELFCVFHDDDNGKLYSGWIATHKHKHLSYPRLMKLESNDNDTIEVLVDKYYGQLFVKYKDYIGYRYYKGEHVPDIMEDIKQRLSKFI